MDPYNKVFDIVSKLCKTHKIEKKEIDYQALIAGLVDGLGDHGDIVMSKWRTDFQQGGMNYNVFTRKILMEPEIIINGFGEETVVRKNHYMCEIFRIPMTHTCNLSNILKIAAYTALVSFSLKREDFEEGIVRAFKNMNMTSLISYINDIEEYRNNIPSEEIIDNAVDNMLNSIRDQD